MTEAHIQAESILAESILAGTTNQTPRAEASPAQLVTPRGRTPRSGAQAKAVPATQAATAGAADRTGKDDGSDMSSKTLAKLRRLLEEERATYVRQADELAAEAEALANEREPGDAQFDEESGEGDPMTVERERDLALSASARHAVGEIDRALARIESGDYGLCERCHKRIPMARLEALPHAALCVDCKSREERRR
ncbi:MAG: TraR/DksA family transcriptional regulator [Acidimicrobiia bacterium]